MLASHQNYNEYKYQVSDGMLAYVKSILDSLHGGIDPYPKGVVDSIYYDTPSNHLYRQCIDGDPQKTKFRIRGYGDDSYSQLHQKNKDLFTVKKLKQKIIPVSLVGRQAPYWQELQPNNGDENYIAIQSVANQYGELIPAIRVKYYRYRYRIYDYRMTLDTDIEVMGFANGFDYRYEFAKLPHHVLEIKTVDPRPHLPLLGLTRLPQVSFSKFMLGINLLLEGDISGD